MGVSENSSHTPPKFIPFGFATLGRHITLSEPP